MATRGSQYTRSSVGSQLFDEIRKTGRLIVQEDEPVESDKFQTWFKPSTNEFYEKDDAGFVLKGTVNTSNPEQIGLIDLNDVVLNEPISDGEILKFDFALGEWTNKGGELSGLSDVNIPLPVQEETIIVRRGGEWRGLGVGGIEESVYVSGSGELRYGFPVVDATQQPVRNVWDVKEVNYHMSTKLQIANLQPGTFIDGVAVAQDDLILYTGGDGSINFPYSDNGIYKVLATAPPERQENLLSPATKRYYIKSGNEWGGSSWQCNNQTADKYGLNDIFFHRVDNGKRWYGGIFTNTPFPQTLNATINTYDKFLGYNGAMPSWRVTTDTFNNQLEIISPVNRVFEVEYDASWEKITNGNIVFSFMLFYQVNGGPELELTSSKSIRRYQNNDVYGASGSAFLNVNAADVVNVYLKIASDTSSAQLNMISGNLTGTEIN